MTAQPKRKVKLSTRKTYFPKSQYVPVKEVSEKIEALVKKAQEYDREWKEKING